MPSSGMWHRVTLMSTDVSEECAASIIRVKGFTWTGTAIALAAAEVRCEGLMICTVHQSLVTGNLLLAR
jgi:hypothetical protein